MRKKLTEKQRRFVEHYIVNANAAAAARAAGYSDLYADKSSWELLRAPQYRHVQEAIERKFKRMSDKLEITAEDVRRELWEALQVAKASVKPALNSKTGKPITDNEGNAVYRVDLQAWLKACELLGKLTSVAAFKEHVKIDMDRDLIDRLNAGRNRSKGEE